jgi:quinohemoprotein amine dehydrogenase
VNLVQSRSRRWLASLLILLPACAGRAQSINAAAEEGIPVTDPLVIAKCGSCHVSDERGNMQSISWSRTTPEGWQDILKDMIVMNGLSVTPAEARPIVKYLSTTHGLAPAESRPVMYDPERLVRDESIPTDGLRDSCAKCHYFARPLSWRRSPQEWKRFDESHAKRYKYRPNAEAVTFLAGAAPLHSPEWDAWSARSKVPELTGRWLVTASLPGHGDYFGEMQVDATGDEEFSTRVNLTSVRDGSKVQRTGRSAVYGGTAWRGRSAGAISSSTVNNPAPDDPSSDAREVMGVAANHLEAEGRWFWGQYQEFGFQVQLRRASAGATLLSIDRPYLKPGSRGNRVRVIGDNFPGGVESADLNFGAGVTVRSVSSTAAEIVADIDVASNAPAGKRDVSFRGVRLPGAIAVYDRIDYIKVTPESAMAAFGDSIHPRGYQQFQAIGYQRGPDGKAHTDDDVALGPVDVSWSVRVFHASDDGSSDSVGRVSAAGLLSPAPANPKANFDVWVIATARDEKDAAGEPLTGRAYVVITVPAYAFNGRQYVRDLERWVDAGPATGATR